MICQSCGLEAPTRKVFFMQHIGAVVLFFHKRIGGQFCRNCVNKYFAEFTLKTFFLGWWGVISFFATPIVLIVNIVNYFRAWTLAPVPPGATVPQLDDAVVGRLQTVTSELIDRLNKGETLDAVAVAIGPKARATPGQVVRYVQALIAQQKAAKK